MSAQNRFLIFLLCSACIFAIPAHSQTIPYNVSRVGNADSQGVGINNAGTVVGRTFGPDSTFRAFVNTGAGPVDLGTLGGVNSIAADVNDAGQVVGSADTADGRTHAFIYQGGRMSDLGTLGGDNSNAFSINGSGTVVGSAFPPPASDPNAFTGPRAFVRPPGGQLQDIGTLPFPSPFAEAHDINNRGQVVGTSGQFGPGDPPAHPFLYTDGVMTDLGTFGGDFSIAFAINDLGQVVGYSNVPTGLHVPHAFLYQDGALTDLDARLGGGGNSTASDINNQGQIIGGSAGLGAYILRGDDVASLNALVDPATGWQIADVSAINDQGQIAGTGVFNGTRYAVLLTPVPEPGTVGMLLLGFGVLALSLRCGGCRKRQP